MASPRHHPAIMLLLLAFTTLAPAQPVWESLKGPYGGQVGFLAANVSGEIYAATYDMGIFRSTNEGRSWIPTSWKSSGSVDGGAFLRCLASPDSNLLLTAINAGPSLRSSTDHGMTWRVDSAGAQTLYSIGAVSTSPLGTIFAIGKFDGRVYRSTDHAETWTVSEAYMVPTEIFQMTVDSAGRLFAIFDRKGIYRSLDDGLHWESVNRNLPDSLISSIVTMNAMAVVASSESGMIFVSTDAGDHWTTNGTVHYYTNMLATSPNGDVLALTDTAGLLRTTNLGITWTSVHPASQYAGTFLVLPNGHYVDARDLHIAVSANEGLTWEDRTSNMSGLRSVCLATLPGYVFVGTSFGAFGRWESASARWDVLPLQTITTNVNNMLVVSSHSILIAPSDGGLQRSPDLGESWIWTSAPGSRVLAKSSHNTLFASTGGQGGEFGSLFRSSDSGVTWSSADIGEHIINSIVAASDGRLFAGTDVGFQMPPPELLKSTDDGITWSAGPRMNVQLRAIDSSGVLYASTMPRDAFDSAGHYYVLPDSLLRSSDNGATWSCVDTTFIGPMVVNQRGDIFLAGGWSSAYGRVKRSTDGGKSWQEYSSGLDGSNVESIVVDTAGFVYCATWNGGVYRSIQSTLDVRTPEHIPTRISLAPNFPNPFSESTTLNYTLDQGAHVRLSVVDAVGRERALLVDERQSSGAHATCFSAGACATGAYTVRLLVNGRVCSRMVVIDR